MFGCSSRGPPSSGVLIPYPYPHPHHHPRSQHKCSTCDISRASRSSSSSLLPASPANQAIRNRTPIHSGKQSPISQHGKGKITPSPCVYVHLPLPGPQLVYPYPSHPTAPHPISLQSTLSVIRYTKTHPKSHDTPPRLSLPAPRPVEKKVEDNLARLPICRVIHPTRASRFPE